MMQAAAQAAADTARRLNQSKPLVIAVTVLTSMDEETLRAGGVERSPFRSCGRACSDGQAGRA